MKATLTIITIIVTTFTAAMVTSMLLDNPFISAHWARQTLIIIAMALEVAIGLSMAGHAVTNQKK